MRFAVLFCLFFVVVVYSQNTTKERLFLTQKVELYKKEPDSLKKYANAIIEFSRKNSLRLFEADGFLGLSQAYFTEHSFDQSELYAKKALEIYLSVDESNKKQAATYRVLGNLELYKDNVDSSYSYFKKAEKLFEEVPNYKNNEDFYFLRNDLAYLLILSEKHDDALELLKESQRKAPTKEVLANTYSLFSVMANHNNDYKESIKYFKLCIPIYKELNLQKNVLICQLNIAVNYYHLKEYDKAISEFNLFLDKLSRSESQQDKYLIFRANLFLSKCYFELEKYEQANLYFKKTNSFEADVLIDELYTITKIDFLLYEKKYQQADSFINKRLNESNIDVNSKLAYYKQLKKIAEAIDDSKKLEVVKDSIMYFQYQQQLKSKSKLIELMDTEFKISTIQKELDLAEQREKHNKIIVISLVVIEIIILVFFIIFFMHQKRLNSVKELALKKEKQHLELVNKQKALEIEFKNKEIVDFALHISEKNEMLSEIKEKLKVLTLGEINIKKEVNELIFFINNTINQNSEKIKVYSDAEDVKDSFFQKLKVLYPNLTEKETRVASLVRMKLSSKQIGQQLSITSASVDNYRSLLRKKMQIPKQKSLQEFLTDLV